MACEAAWPEYDESKMVESEKEIAVQINGKFRGTVIVPADSDEDTVISIAKSNEKVARAMEGMEISRSIVVKNKLVNLILRPAK